MGPPDGKSFVMFPENRIRSPLSIPFVLLTLSLMLAGPPSAGAGESSDVASLSRNRPRSVVPGSLAPSDSYQAAEIRTPAEALILLQKIEQGLRAAPGARGDIDRLRSQTAAAGAFLRKRLPGKAGATRYQWHQVSHLRPDVGARHLILRPIQAVPFISALDLKVSGGPMRIDVIRAYGASGIVFEFHPRRSMDSSVREAMSRFCLEREISLTAVEIFCGPVESAELEIAVRGGIAVEPSVENACLHALHLAQAEIERERFDRAARHVRASIEAFKRVR